MYLTPCFISFVSTQRAKYLHFNWAVYSKPNPSQTSNHHSHKSFKRASQFCEDPWSSEVQDWRALRLPFFSTNRNTCVHNLCHAVPAAIVLIAVQAYFLTSMDPASHWSQETCHRKHSRNDPAHRKSPSNKEVNGRTRSSSAFPH